MPVPKHQSWDNPRCAILKAMKDAHPMSRNLCLICKGGRLLCGHKTCPLLQRINIRLPFEKKISKSLEGPATSIFVGWQGYPAVFMGPMVSVDDKSTDNLDDPSKWYGLDFNDIIGLRSRIVRSKKLQRVKETTEIRARSQELALSTKPTDIEVEFKEKPSFNLSFSPISQPMGASGMLKRLDVVDNPKIPKKVDSMVSDEVRSEDALAELYTSGFDVYYLTNVLSSGALGAEADKKVVPTRWSITGVDDILGKKLMNSIKDYPPVNEFCVYTNEYLGNHFEILFMPYSWQFEQFEVWAPKTLWTLSRTKPAIVSEYEGGRGRSTYAINEGGGYYAGRFAVLEALYRMRRQACVVVFREIYDSYIMPVGVWEVRENVRKALGKPCGKFATLKDALDNIKQRLIVPIGEYLKRSSILCQTRLI